MTAMAVTMRVETAATETSIAHSAILRPSAVRIGPLVGSAVAARHETHRYGTDGRGAHQGQDDAARSFHVVAWAMTVVIQACTPLGDK
jgi:hypothetical protein